MEIDYKDRIPKALFNYEGITEVRGKWDLPWIDPSIYAETYKNLGKLVEKYQNKLSQYEKIRDSYITAHVMQTILEEKSSSTDTNEVAELFAEMIDEINGIVNKMNRDDLIELSDCLNIG